MKKVAVIMGSDSDLKVVEKAITTLKNYGVETEVHIYSAHRTPVEAKEFTANARANGVGVIIAAAGKAAHLAGAIAANTTLPVIGIPIKASALEGIDALLSTVQMPAGIPVATVAIDGAENAALLAIQILAVEDKELAEKLQNARDEKKAKILYDFLDESKLFKGTVEKKDRSLMNVPFVTGNEELDAKFVKEAKAAGFENLKGHRSVGGMRASIYNAMPIEGVEKLVEFMKKFEAENC